ncbi:hypothetical protein [Kitasatospora sp. NBC_00315]|uniref:hypothetical protein n=1 Tax=Kitasatospora sp. NBC_00315 TaxID=2975963 RepID=UPI0032524780
MHKRRRFAAVAAAVTLVSIGALPTAGAAAAAPVASASAGAPALTTDSPVSVGLAGGPAEFTTGAAPVELTATFTNHADHTVTAQAQFVIADVNSGILESEVALQVQAPGAPWQSAVLHAGANVGAAFELTPGDSRMSLNAGESVVYRLRLSFVAGAHTGVATAALSTAVTDPSLPPEQRVSNPRDNGIRFTVVAPGGPADPIAPAAPTLDVEGVPAVIVAGASPQTFRATVTNHSGRDLRFLPSLGLRATGPLTVPQTHAEFQDAGGAWLPASEDASGGPNDGRLTLLLKTGDKSTDVVELHDGESRTIALRLAFAADAPLGAASVALTGWSLALGNSTATPVEAGSAEAGFMLVAATGTPTASPPAGVVPAPTVTATVTATATATASAPGSPPAPAATVVAQAADLAHTGGASGAVPLAVGGTATAAVGVGMLVGLRRRQGARRTGA